jgi:predicted Zn finger-like uncharacterized protein
MFTQCPSCKTTFQVTAEQLKAANGDVRCGHCLTVFSALDNLSEIEPLSKEHDEEVGNTSDKAASVAQNTNTGDANTSIDKNLEEFFGDLFEDSPDETFDEPITYANPETSTEGPTKPGNSFFYGANEATIEKILEEKSELETNTETNFETILDPDEESNLLEPPIETNTETSFETILDSDEESDLLEPPIETNTETSFETILDPDEESDLLEPPIETNFETNFETILDPDEESDLLEPPIETTDHETTDEIEAPEFSSDFGKATEQDDTEASPEDSGSENKTEPTEITNVPDVILDELQAAKEQRLKPPSTQWAVGSIILMLVFVLQAIYFSRDSLAKNPSYRPLLTSACNVLGCEINIEFDTRLIDIIGRDVRTHPTSKKALIAGTTLINNASYAQPYPLLTLTFSDITGTTLAQRRFTPREYLRTGTDVEAGMPSEIPVQVELHLVDPGKAAVNFEFRAEVDPRS